MEAKGYQKEVWIYTNERRPPEVVTVTTEHPPNKSKIHILLKGKGNMYLRWPRFWPTVQILINLKGFKSYELLPMTIRRLN